MVATNVPAVAVKEKSEEEEVIGGFMMDDSSSEDESDWLQFIYNVLFCDHITGNNSKI